MPHQWVGGETKCEEHESPHSSHSRCLINGSCSWNSDLPDSRKLGLNSGAAHLSRGPMPEDATTRRCYCTRLSNQGCRPEPEAPLNWGPAGGSADAWAPLAPDAGSSNGSHAELPGSPRAPGRRAPYRWPRAFPRFPRKGT